MSIIHHGYKNVIQFPVREKKQIIGSKLSNKNAMQLMLRKLREDVLCPNIRFIQ
ncbi:hypothetical protein PN4B1_40740 [Paenibacillus naphthalenovorans]|nr:hypothetical protein PN4B1_40740 [Paenibacillus naphthalenovorans]